jgi:hypothetical protein
MKLLTTFLLCLVYTIAAAQTKKIAFKSHSGSMENFSTALEKDLFDMDNSNFGMAPQRDIISAQLDSVIYVSDSVVMLITSNYCSRTDRPNAKANNKPNLWTAGREMVYSHPLFSRNHSLDSIKQVIKSEYYFKNPVEKVVFVGYDNKKRKYKNSSVVPVTDVPGSNNQSPFDGQFITIISLILGASLVAGLAIWHYCKTDEKRRMAMA